MIQCLPTFGERERSDVSAACSLSEGDDSSARDEPLISATLSTSLLIKTCDNRKQASAYKD